jgi:mannose-1-phosphate guanylyltransferase
MAVMSLSCPCDHLVRDHAFVAAVARAARLAQNGSLVTPASLCAPETGFGYIECGAPLRAKTARGHGRPICREAAARKARTPCRGNYL